MWKSIQHPILAFLFVLATAIITALPIGCGSDPSTQEQTTTPDASQSIEQTTPDSPTTTQTDTDNVTDTPPLPPDTDPGDLCCEADGGNTDPPKPDADPVDAGPGADGQPDAPWNKDAQPHDPPDDQPDAPTGADSGPIADQPAPSGVLDPRGCMQLTNAELRQYGYEPVKAHGAKGDGKTDDTAAIKKAIAEANKLRRVVYLHPGTYLVSDTLEFIQDAEKTRSNNGDNRFGQMLLGSYCGKTRPTIRLKDNTARQTNEQKNAAEPFPVVLLWRFQAGAKGPDDTNGGLDWNQTVRNVHIVLGNNPGAVGLRHMGAEGCSASEVSVDARGGFAGFYNLNSSGGYTYNIEVRGGQYGLYIEHTRGGSVLVAGVTLYEQQKTPVAIGTYTPVGLVGFHIRANKGQVISTISGPDNNHTVNGKLTSTFHDSSGHIYLIDGQIEVKGGNLPILHNTNRSVYMKNVYVRGTKDILINDVTKGKLQAQNSSKWTHISEFNYSGPYSSMYGDAGVLVAGKKSDQTYYKGKLYNTDQNIAVTTSATPPANLRTRHLYPVAICNIEGKDNVFVTDYGADPSDTKDDTAAIKKAIAEAKRIGGRVFMPASPAAPNTGALLGHYIISSTLELGANAILCGVTRYSTVLNAEGWKNPTTNSPVIRTVDDKNARTTIADLKIRVGNPTGNQKTGYKPHVYALHWRAGANSLYRDAYMNRAWGDPGNIRLVVVSGAGGGKFFGVTQHGGFPPPGCKENSPEKCSMTDAQGTYFTSPDARHLLVENNTEPLSFYPFHCQHMTHPKGVLCELKNAKKVTIYSAKSEIGSTPGRAKAIIRRNPANLITIWMRITNSSQIGIYGHETLAQTAKGRGMIEVNNNTDLTIASMGRRGNGTSDPHVEVPLDQFYFVKETGTNGTHFVRAHSFLSLYKSN